MSLLLGEWELSDRCGESWDELEEDEGGRRFYTFVTTVARFLQQPLTG